MLAFRPLTPADCPLLLSWLARPHVKQWWDDGDDTLEKVAQHYSGQDEGEEVARFILLYDPEPEGRPTRPIGYFQYYLLPDGTAGIDLFIGEAELLDRGLGTRAIRQFLDLLIARHGPPRVIVDPHPANHRAIRAYEKAGFRFYETATAPDGTPAYMMEIRPSG